MRTTIAALSALLSLVLFSCGGGPSVPGTYTLDIGQMVEAAQKEMDSKAAEAGAAGEMMKGMMKAMLDQLKDSTGEFEIKADNTFVGEMEMMGQKSTIKGTWKLEGDKITMTSTEQDGEKKTETKVGVVKGDEIHIDESQGEMKLTLVMRKKKS